MDNDTSQCSSHTTESDNIKNDETSIVTEVKMEGDKEVSEKPGKFHVNKALIPGAQLNDIQESSELEGLGLDVFNQEDFEQGVMAQVDQVLAAEEEERKRKIIEKQIKAVEDDIKMVKQEMLDIERVLTSLSSGQSEYTKRRIDSVRRQKETKISHMKTLQAKHKSLLRKLPGASVEEGEEESENFDINQVLGLTAGPSKETEREKMIRLGEMTPFGTVVSKPTTSSDKKISSISLTQNSSFDQFFMDKDNARVSQKKPTPKVQSELNKKLERMKASLTEDSKKSEKKKKTEKSTSDEDNKKKGKCKSKRKNIFDERDNKRYRDDVEGADFSHLKSSKSKFPKMNHNFSEDPVLSDQEERSSDDYQPNEQELAMLSDMSESELKEQIKKKKKNSKEGIWPTQKASKVS